MAPAALAGERWLLGPPELDPTTGAGLLFARTGIEPADVVAYTSHAAAVAAAAAGDGIVLALAHTVIEELRRRALTRIDVRGTPLVEMWHASTLGFGRALPGGAGDAALRHQPRGDGRRSPPAGRGRAPRAPGRGRT